MRPAPHPIRLFALAALLVATAAAAQTTTTSTTSSTSTTLNVNVPHQVTFAQPGYAVVANWSGPALGIPANLGGVLFSQNGAFLHVVGGVNAASSAVYRLSVVRNGFGEIVNLTGPAISVFGGTSAGLDAGLAWGPGGNLFTSYLPAILIAQRVGGLGGLESTFDASSLTGFLTRGVGGLTFNPIRPDPQTGFGRMLANNGVSFDLREILLMPGAGGVYAPIGSQSFVRVQPSSGAGGFGQFKFLGGTFQGDLMYASYTDGELRIVDIDPATGLPYAEPTCGMSGCTPVLGTPDPIDTLFASGFGQDTDPTFNPGPFGLDVDPLTNDLFVTTSGGSPANVIFRITGFGGSVTTTTTLPTSTTSSSTSSTSTLPPTTVTTSSTSSTSSSSSTLATSTTASSTSFSTSSSATSSTLGSTSTSATSSTVGSSSSSSSTSSTASTSSSTSSSTTSTSSTSSTSVTTATSTSSSTSSTSTSTTTTTGPSTSLTSTTTSTSSTTSTTLAGCGPTPREDCAGATRGRLVVTENVAGKGRLQLLLKNLVPTAEQAAFGDPVSGAMRLDVCVYDAGPRLAGSLTVARGGATCGDAKPCWKTLGTKGYRYADPDASADGVLQIVARGGPKRSRIAVKARNRPSKGWNSLPTGIAPALQRASAVTVQVLVSDGACFGGTLRGVRRAEADAFKAAGPLR